MDVYLDASVIVSVLTNDTLTSRAQVFMATGSATRFHVSDFTKAEVASVIARRVRRGDPTEAEVRTASPSSTNEQGHSRNGPRPPRPTSPPGPLSSAA